MRLIAILLLSSVMGCTSALELAAQRQVWRTLSAPVQVDTPDPAFDALVNHWLPAQVLGCRVGTVKSRINRARIEFRDAYLRLKRLD